MTAMPSRRHILTATAGVVGVAVLAACAPKKKARALPTTSSGQTVLAELDSIQVGDSVTVKNAAGKPVAITRTGEDSAVAHSAICTHRGCTVEPRGADLHCPCHGSLFSAATGAVLHGPATTPLPSVAVTVADGLVVAE